MTNLQAYAKQIVVITDGRSNLGLNPIKAATTSKNEGIRVSCIGIFNKSPQRDSELQEIKDIAEAGGGVYEVCSIENLSQTLRTVTHKTIQSTMESIINKQLREIVGVEIDGITPESRTKVIKYLEQLEDKISVESVILLDCSGSMINKLEKAVESLLRLTTYFKDREGNSVFYVVAYPGEGKDNVRVLCDSSYANQELLSQVKAIKAGGKTPTGPAILDAVSILKGEKVIQEVLEEECVEEYIV